MWFFFKISVIWNISSQFSIFAHDFLIWHITKVSWIWIFNKQHFSSVFSLVSSRIYIFFNNDKPVWLSDMPLVIWLWEHGLIFLSLNFIACKIKIILLCKFLMRIKWYVLVFFFQLVKCLLYTKVPAIFLSIIYLFWYVMIYESKFRFPW